MTRHLVVVLGDQLDAGAAAWDGFDAAQDVAWMAEVAGESTHVWSTQPRIAMFLSAMRHFARGLRQRGIPLDYRHLEDARSTLEQELREALARHRPRRIVVTEPGEWRVLGMLHTVAQTVATPLDVRIDRHFLCTVTEFEQHARAQRELRMEFFYREQRVRYGVLMDGEVPAGGRWNFDSENRAGFGAAGPGLLAAPLQHPPDDITKEVIRLVERRFADHPGSLAHFGWATTPEQARASLDDFVANRLPTFGHWQDAMWTGEPFLHHAALSAAMNLKLLDPRDAIAEAERAYREGAVELASAEGFIRQILGWREYVRGIYWARMPGYLDLNAMDAHAPLPWFYWTGQTEMRCLHHVITQTLDYGYAHHIQRLMVTGLYAMLLGVDPVEVHKWYLAVYVDAVEWVELPNTLGMSQYGDGGLMASKPYAASGRYIEKMSDYCGGCRFDPGKRTGEDACPFTTLYWDFLLRHADALKKNRRIEPQVRNALALPREEREAVAGRAAEMKRAAQGGP